MKAAASFAVDSDLSVNPSVQAIRCAEPDAAIPSRQHRHNSVTGQPLSLGDPGNRELVKTVKTFVGSCPDVSLMVLKDTGNAIAAKAVIRRESIYPATMYV